MLIAPAQRKGVPRVTFLPPTVKFPSSAITLVLVGRQSPALGSDRFRPPAHRACALLARRPTRFGFRTLR